MCVSAKDGRVTFGMCATPKRLSKTISAPLSVFGDAFRSPAPKSKKKKKHAYTVARLNSQNYKTLTLVVRLKVV